MTPELVIRNGLVLDGTGSDGEVADVAIAGGTIVTIGMVDRVDCRELDASGLPLGTASN